MGGLIVLAGIAVVVGGTVYLRACAEKRLNLPARKKRTSPLAMLALLGMLAFAAFELLPTLLEMKAADKIELANNVAKYIYHQAQEFAETADAADCVTVIGQLGDTDTPLAACLNRNAEGSRMEDYYAVVFEEGELRFVLYSGHPLAPDDLHKPDYQAQKKALLWKIGSSYQDAVGYYARSEPPDSKEEMS